MTKLHAATATVASVALIIFTITLLISLFGGGYAKIASAIEIISLVIFVISSAVFIYITPIKEVLFA